MVGRSEYPKSTPFMERIQFEPMSGCWLWDGSRDGRGYGQYRDPVTNKNLRAHRVCYEIHKGEIGDGLELDHKCRNRACINPDHLEPVSHRENSLRGVSPAAINSKKTKCPAGHTYDEPNTHINLSGDRRCRECDKIKKAQLRRERGVAIKRREPICCPYGHLYKVMDSGRRVCRTCDAIRHYNKRHTKCPKPFKED